MIYLYMGLEACKLQYVVVEYPADVLVGQHAVGRQLPAGAVLGLKDVYPLPPACTAFLKICLRSKS